MVRRNDFSGFTAEVYPPPAGRFSKCRWQPSGAARLPERAMSWPGLDVLTGLDQQAAQVTEHEVVLAVPDPQPVLAIGSPEAGIPHDMALDGRSHLGAARS